MKKAILYFILSISVFASLYTNAQSWMSVGSPGFSIAQADNATIDIDSSGTPYVAYLDEGTSLYQATVMKYDGTNWVPGGL